MGGIAGGAVLYGAANGCAFCHSVYGLRRRAAQKISAMVFRRSRAGCRDFPRIQFCRFSLALLALLPTKARRILATELAQVGCRDGRRPDQPGPRPSHVYA